MWGSVADMLEQQQKQHENCLADLHTCNSKKEAVVSELEQSKGEKQAVVSELEQCKGEKGGSGE